MKSIMKFFITIIIITGGGLAIWVMFSSFQNNVEILPASKAITQLSEDETAIVIDGEFISTNSLPKVIDDIIYIPFEIANKNISQNLYMDIEEGVLTYTTNDKVFRIKADDDIYFINGEGYKMKYKFKLIDEQMYIPMTFLLQQFDLDVQYNDYLDLVIIDSNDISKRVGQVNTNKGYFRYYPEEESPALSKLNVGQQLIIYGEESGYYKVRNGEGIVGYVKKEYVKNVRIIYSRVEDDEKVDYTKDNIEGKVNVAWHQITNDRANSSVKDKFSNAMGLDVISPTWFSLGNSNGDVNSLASKEYVTWAHSRGYQVWALFDNRFDSKLTSKVLGSTLKREKVIDQILAYVDIYNLDGINVDFESVAKEDGPNFVQFIKELAPRLRQEEIVVSVDCYVPSAWTKHYNRKELAKVVDYIMVMAYDEHWSTSKESGSVASIGFVEKAIVNTLKEVPKEKILLGLPFYTRLWTEKEEDGKVQVSSKAFGMESAYNNLKENKADIEWNSEVAQYYGEYSENDITYKIWLEDERSIEEKVKLMKEYDLAGVSGWKKGLEKDEIWKLLQNYLK